MRDMENSVDKERLVMSLRLLSAYLDSLAFVSLQAWSRWKMRDNKNNVVLDGISMQLPRCARFTTAQGLQPPLCTIFQMFADWSERLPMQCLFPSEASLVTLTRNLFIRLDFVRAIHSFSSID